MVTRQLQVERRTGKVRRSKTNVLYHAPYHVTSHFDKVSRSKYESSSTGNVCRGEGKLRFKKLTEPSRILFAIFLTAHPGPWPIPAGVNTVRKKNPSFGHSSRALQIDEIAIPIAKR